MAYTHEIVKRIRKKKEKRGRKGTTYTSCVSIFNRSSFSIM